jgi:NCS1 family nucleobase:cation symporter-1
MYFGGQTFVLILNALSPSFLHMKNTLPASAGITTPGLIGFVLFIILYFPLPCSASWAGPSTQTAAAQVIS